MKYFTIQELTHSTIASQRGVDNTPSDLQSANLTLLVENVLDPLREAYGNSLKVNSGFRSPALNATVGGAKNSDHINGNAADITAGSKEENKKLFELAQKLDLPFDQLIDEKGFSWIHISYRKEGGRKQVFAIK